MNHEFADNGFMLYENFFDKEEIENVLYDAKRIFFKQIKNNGISSNESLIYSEKEFESALFNLFQVDFSGFVNCGKQIQHLISLHRLSVQAKIEDKLKDLGLSFPNISTRPVLFFNSPSLAREKVYHTVFPHQDWFSMQGSLDSIVIWLPLVNVTKENGALEILPNSHKNGLQVSEVDHSFGKVIIDEKDNDSFLSLEVNAGDALFFSSFLVHRSGNNTSGGIRWSAHFRYNNLDETTFINRKYPHPYIYRPQDELITKNFPNQSDINKLFSEK